MKALLFIVIACGMAACGKAEPKSSARIEYVHDLGIVCWRLNAGSPRDSTPWTCGNPTPSTTQ